MARRASTRVLFIGNSFTARGDLPGLVATLGEATTGRSIRHDLVAAGGASLRRHWNTGRARQRIARGRFDYVVLQEQSTLPIKNPARHYENVRAFAGPIAASGARLVLFETWARRDAPETQLLLSRHARRIGRETGAIVVRAGAAWRAFQRRHDAPELHDRDGSHPTFAGTYLAACCFVAALFDGDCRPAEGSARGLDERDRRRIASVAWRVARRAAAKRR